ncbi:MAG: hypothetical protein UV02_C0015G0020, partial [Candidatus Kuenenbacteria bacterium GW2011_GWA2_42_15]
MPKTIYQTPKEEIKSELNAVLKIGEEKGYFIRDN